MTTRDESKKEMATEKKDDKNTAAEFNNKEARDQNGAARYVLVNLETVSRV